MSTKQHTAIVFPGLGEKLKEIKVDTPAIKPGHVLIRVLYASTTPFDVWQGYHGLIVKEWPLIPSDSLSGVVAEVADDVKHLKVGDEVLSFTFGTNESRAAQEFALIPANRVGKIASNVPIADATTVPNNLVTVIHSFTNDLKLPLKLVDSDPDVAPEFLNKRILIWGSGTSVGQYAIQVLKLSGYKNIITTASTRHHAYLKEIGASVTVDYNSKTLESDIGENVTYALDCVGDVEESLRKIGKVVKPSSESRVAAMLPLRVGGKQVDKVVLEFEKGVLPDQVIYSGVRTHFYEQNAHYKEILQPQIVPELLASGKIKPNRVTIVNDQPSRLANYQKAIDLLYKGDVSGEKLVIQISNK